jgi:hypothetical protein
MHDRLGSRQRFQPTRAASLYCAEHDKWELQHNEVARAWRDGGNNRQVDLAYVRRTPFAEVYYVDAFTVRASDVRNDVSPVLRYTLSAFWCTDPLERMLRLLISSQ